MTEGLHATRPSGPLFRIARGRNPWEWPDWIYADPDGTFGNRYDDPESLYRVLYSSSDRLGAFVECLARFRPDPKVMAGLAEIEGHDGGALSPGQVSRSWLAIRQMGSVTVEGEFVDVGHSSSLQWLRRAMAPRLVEHGIEDLDGAAIRMSAPRRFTQEISRQVYELSEGGKRRYTGIAYLSRLGDDFTNWAIFEPAAIEPWLAENLYDTDPDFRRALALLHLTVVDG